MTDETFREDEVIRTLEELASWGAEIGAKLALVPAPAAARIARVAEWLLSERRKRPSTARSQQTGASGSSPRKTRVRTPAARRTH